MLYKDKKIVHGRNLNYIRIAILILYTIFIMAFSVYSLSSPNYFLSLLLILLIIYIRKTKYKFYDETYYIYEDKVIIKRVDKKIEIKISDIDHLETHSEYKNIGDVIIYTNNKKHYLLDNIHYKKAYKIISELIENKHQN